MKRKKKDWQKEERFIEHLFPVKEVSEQSAREKNIRHGHISTLHIWWARRPLAASRTTAYAAFIPFKADMHYIAEKMEFIAKLADYDTVKNNPGILAKARNDILEFTGGYTPKVLDPFAGGGSIPLEAARLGMEAYALDYNPVAVLINRAILEYPAKFGRPGKVKGPPLKSDKMIKSQKVPNLLAEEVRLWGQWVIQRAEEELREFYRSDDPDETIVGYLWARTIRCSNPACKAEIPLHRQYWLAKKKGRKIALHPVVNPASHTISFEIVGDGYKPMPEGFDPGKGTIQRANVTCPVCGTVSKRDYVVEEFRSGRAGERLVAVVYTKKNAGGKFYRLPTEDDLRRFEKAREYLKRKREEFKKKWGFDPVPEEEINTLSHSVNRPPMYGMDKWYKLFNPRQLLALIVFLDKIKEAQKKMEEMGYDKELADAVVTYLGMFLSSLTHRMTKLCRWIVQNEAIGYTFSRQALQMVWDYIESPLSNHTDITSFFVESLSSISHQTPGTTILGSATSLPFEDNFFDAVFTDPPYYDNIGYSHLSDFFYVWLKRALGNVHQDIFSTKLTPKSDEIVVTDRKGEDRKESKKKFYSMMTSAMREIHRVLRPHGIAIVVYAHKSMAGWESMIEAMLSSGLTITAAWPINTEKRGRTNSQNAAALASSLYIVARKMDKEDTGWWGEIQGRIRRRIKETFLNLYKNRITGSDLMIATIGITLEEVGKYKQILDESTGKSVTVGEILDKIQEFVSKEALNTILSGKDIKVDDVSKFYLLFRYAYNGGAIPFDDARKMGISVGVEVEKLMQRKKGTAPLVKKEKSDVRLLSFKERKPDIEILQTSPYLIDRIHAALNLYANRRVSDAVEVLMSSPFSPADIIGYLHALQSIVPPGSEKSALEFLAKRVAEAGEKKARPEDNRLFGGEGDE